MLWRWCVSAYGAGVQFWGNIYWIRLEDLRTLFRLLERITNSGRVFCDGVGIGPWIGLGWEYDHDHDTVCAGSAVWIFGNEPSMPRLVWGAAVYLCR